MDLINTPEPNDEQLIAFNRCWAAARDHVERMLQGIHRYEGGSLLVGQGKWGWLKGLFFPPFLEHLSFRVGNQLFFVRVVDPSGELVPPGSEDGLRYIADACKGHACFMPMHRVGEEWRPMLPGWGLQDGGSGRDTGSGWGVPVLNPTSLASDELIEMTDWELQDLAVQVVRGHIEEQGREVMSWQGNPAVDPSLWFVGEEGPEWVVARFARFPNDEPELPGNIHDIAESCKALGHVGHFAAVSVANTSSGFDLEKEVIPIWRGQSVLVNFLGLTSAQ